MGQHGASSGQGRDLHRKLPELFEYWVEQLARQTRERFAGDERLLFVNAWNEWGEGCHLEPDARYGQQYLEALRRGIQAD